MDTAELSNTVWDLGDSVSMRPVAESDIDQVLDAVTRNYDHLRTFMEWAKPDYSRKDAEEWVAKAAKRTGDDQPLNFCIFRGDRMIGTIGFATFDNEAMVTEIGYWIDASEQGKGIMSRATRKLLELAFENLGMNRVQIRCASGNLRSAAIPTKFGFKQEGVQRQHIIRHGRIYDFWIFGLLKDEWLRREGNTTR
jgi:ribosomal-protein-serine acetyltransferase